MGDADDGGRKQLVREQLHHARFIGCIQRGRRLVQDHKCWPLDQNPCERKTLLFAAREEFIPWPVEIE